MEELEHSFDITPSPDNWALDRIYLDEANIIHYYPSFRINLYTVGLHGLGGTRYGGDGRWAHLNYINIVSRENKLQHIPSN